MRLNPRSRKPSFVWPGPPCCPPARPPRRFLGLRSSSAWTPPAPGLSNPPATATGQISRRPDTQGGAEPPNLTLQLASHPTCRPTLSSPRARSGGLGRRFFYVSMLFSPTHFFPFKLPFSFASKKNKSPPPQAPALWDWLKGLCFNCLDNVVAAILLKAITPAAKSQAL